MTKLSYFTRLLKGAHATRVVASVNTGSNISVRLERVTPAINSPLRGHLRPQQLRPEEAVIFIECSWRLGDGKSIIASSADYDEPDAAEYEGLNRLLGSAISKCTVRRPFFDLSVTFDAGLRLDIFCDRTTEDDSNYTLETCYSACTVLSSGEIIIREKASNPRTPRIVKDT